LFRYEKDASKAGILFVFLSWSDVKLKQNINFYSKTNQMHQYIKFILFWDYTVHVSDGLSVHHQEFKSLHTATGICQTDTAVCLLAGTR